MKWITAQNGNFLINLDRMAWAGLNEMEAGTYKIEVSGSEPESIEFLIGKYHNKTQAVEILEAISNGYIARIPPCECSGCRKERGDRDEQDVIHNRI